MLLRTKFYFPRPDARWVSRPRLLARLNSDLPRGLTLVMAPAGYGKSTLVNQWLSVRGSTASWLSLEREDDDPERFLRYLVASIRAAVPSACETAGAMASGAHFPPTPSFVDALINDLDALAEPLTIVLDDYHLVNDSRIHAAVGHIIGHLPPSIDLVIISRTDPPWKLARMRGQGQIVEVRAPDLAFTLDETRTLFGEAVPRGRMSGEREDWIALLHDRTEGWAAGLRLAKLSLQDQHAAALPAAFSGANRYVMDYLIEEVLGHQSPEMQSFLLTAAVAERFCAPLCDVLRDRQDRSRLSSEDALVYLDQHGLFLIALDDEGKWFRFHHLFRDLLLHHLGRKHPAHCMERLHLRASTWFEGEGYLEEAIRHSVLADQPVRAARIVERHGGALLERVLAFAPEVEALLSQLPAVVLRERPALLALQAFLAYSVSDMAGMARRVDEADRQLAQPHDDMSAEDITAVRGTLDWLRAISLFAAGELPASRASSAQALLDLRPERRFERAMALNFHAVARALQGETDEARQALEGALAREDEPASECANVLLSALCRLEMHTGNLDRALQFAARLAEPAPGRGRYWVALGHNVLGRILHDQWDLDRAAAHHEYVLANRYGIGRRSIFESLAGLAWIRLAQGDVDGARAHAEQARAYALDAQDAYLRELAASLDAGLALAQEERAAALSHKRHLQQRSNIGAALWRMEPRLRWAQLHIAQALPQPVAEAVADLRRCLADAERSHNAYQAVEVRALLALGLDAQAKRGQALSSLKRAVQDAAQQGCVRVFVELGLPMFELLGRLAAHLSVRREAGSALHVGRIMAAFGPAEAKTDGAPYGRAIAAVEQLSTQALLTAREREILVLLAAGRANEAIAEQLVLSVFTVKTHARNIYAKLKVENRRQAVAKARMLGILPHSVANTPNLLPAH